MYFSAQSSWWEFGRRKSAIGTNTPRPKNNILEQQLF